MIFSRRGIAPGAWKIEQWENRFNRFVPTFHVQERSLTVAFRISCDTCSVSLVIFIRRVAVSGITSDFWPLSIGYNATISSRHGLRNCTCPVWGGGGKEFPPHVSSWAQCLGDGNETGNIHLYYDFRARRHTWRFCNQIWKQRNSGNLIRKGIAQ